MMKQGQLESSRGLYRNAGRIMSMTGSQMLGTNSATGMMTSKVGEVRSRTRDVMKVAMHCNASVLRRC